MGTGCGDDEQDVRSGREACARPVAEDPTGARRAVIGTPPAGVDGGASIVAGERRGHAYERNLTRPYRPLTGLEAAHQFPSLR